MPDLRPDVPGPLNTAAVVGLSRPGSVLLERHDRLTGADPSESVVVVATRVMVKYRLLDDGTVVLSRSVGNHYQGPGLRNPTKRFSRWATDTVDRIAVKPGQPWRITTRRKAEPGRAAQHVPWQTTYAFAETSLSALGLPREFAERADDLLPPRPSMWAHYPLLHAYMGRPRRPEAMANSPVFTRQWNDHHVGTALARWAPPEVRRAFVGAATAQDLTRNLFGSTRYRRDLVKATAQASLPDLVLAWQMRGLVPVDWLVAVMRDGLIEGSLFPPHLRPHLRALDQQSLRNLLRDRAPSMRVLNDIARFPRADTLPRVRGWGDLHDAVVDHALIYRSAHTENGARRKPIRLRPWAQALVGVTEAGQRVEIATHEDHLWAWAQKMRHCIGGYGQQMRRGHSLLGAVHARDGSLVANFEVTVHHRPRPQVEGRAEARAEDQADEQVPDLCLLQLLGRHNSPLPAPTRDDVTAWLAANGVTVPENYWGSETAAPRLLAAA